MKYMIKKILKNIYWNAYGRTKKNPLLPHDINSILFICKGNICRSPFAERIAERIVSEHVNCSKSYIFSSAGIYVSEPKYPTPEAITSAKKFGIEMHDHVSRSINYAMMESFGMIAVMEVWQYDYLKKLFMEFENKIYLLPLFDKNINNYTNSYIKYNIQDPYGKNMEEYEECYERIKDCVKWLFRHNEIYINIKGTKNRQV